MKCLSICQPFANLIIQNKKTIELRKWNTNFRGVFLIHAPIKIRKEDCKRLKINELKSGLFQRFSDQLFLLLYLVNNVTEKI